MCNSFTIDFDRVNRTLCYNNMTSVNNSLAYVDVFTNFGENVSFNVVFDPVPNYTLQYVQLCVCVRLFQFYSSKIFVRIRMLHAGDVQSTKCIFCVCPLFCLTIYIVDRACVSLTGPHCYMWAVYVHTSFSLLLFAEKTLGIHFKSVHQHLRYNCNTTYGKTQAIVLNWSVRMPVSHRHSFCLFSSMWVHEYPWMTNVSYSVTLP